MWFKKEISVSSKEYRELLDLIVKIDARVKMQDAELANMMDQIKRKSGRYYREKANEEEDAKGSNTQSVFIPE